MIIPPVIVALVGSLIGSDTAGWLTLLSPGDILDGANAWIFAALSENPVIASSNVPGLVYVAAALIVAGGIAIGLTVRRYLRIAA